MKLRKIIINIIRTVIIIFVLIVQLGTIITTLPLMASIYELIGALLFYAAFNTLLYYFLFKCKYKLIKNLYFSCIPESKTL